MARLTFLYWYEPLEIDGETVEGVTAECPRCGHRSSCPGTDLSTVKRCGASLRRECPRGERNIYSSQVFRTLEPS
jgi:hypothetical protein